MGTGFPLLAVLRGEQRAFTSEVFGMLWAGRSHLPSAMGRRARLCDPRGPASSELGAGSWQLTLPVHCSLLLPGFPCASAWGQVPAHAGAAQPCCRAHLGSQQRQAGFSVKVPQSWG